MPRKKTETHAANGNTSSTDNAAGGARDISKFIQHIRLAGRSRGLVKNLGGYDKKRHSPPDFVNATATAFLGKLCGGELAVEAEAFFQKARASLAYKRKEISLDVSSPTAVLTARDFTLEWNYALDEAAPAEWTLTQTLHGMSDGALSGENAATLDELFAGMFDGIVFSLTKGASVESVIDAVESLDTTEDRTNPAPLTVSYPSDCSRCTLRVADVEAEVVFDGGELSMMFPRAGSPRQLIEAFAAVRHAFALTKLGSLAALL